MAKLTETERWEPEVYQLEVTDPAMAGPGGILNRQAEQLANRTAYLKKRADELDDARGSHSSLQKRLETYDGFSPDAQNALAALSMQAMHSAGLANRELQRLQEVKTQRGEVVITNRGIISGCSVSKSSTATRNLSLSKGLCFYGASIVAAAQADNVAVIPSNLTGSDGYCWCYLVKEAGLMKMYCTEVGGSMPDAALPLYKVNVPAGNTSETDPNGNSVSLTDMRRMEQGYPAYFVNAPFASVSLDKPFKDTKYMVSLDVLEYEGGGFQEGHIYVGDRASNGFKIFMNGTIDSARVRWTVSKEEI